MVESSKKSFGFRAVQLDLARQPETVGYILSFIDFVAQYGYNYLVLYLEGRIKTPSFPYLPDEESYSPDEIRQIVTHAGERGLEVVPVVALFGHANLFLNCPELASLAELRGGRMGRFSRSKHVFCPSQGATYEFLERYLQEVAALFPSDYFHAGFDEAWDIGYCDLCADRLEREGQGGIFLKHLKDCHAIVTGKLGKTMMVWDDLFDLYPEALAEAPRDIILCGWHYEKQVELPGGHTGGPQRDVFASYEALGFRYLFAPSAVSIRNVETLTAYARRGNALGGLLTVWELERRFLFSEYPTVAYAGLLWSGEREGETPRGLQEHAIRVVTGLKQKEHVALMRSVLNGQDQELPLARQMYLRGPLSDEEYAQQSLVETALAALESHWAVMPETAGKSLPWEVLNDAWIDLSIESIYFELREAISALYLPRTPASEKAALKRRIKECIDRFTAIRAKRREQWDRLRCDIPSRDCDAYYDGAIQMMAGALEEADHVHALLKVRFGTGQASVDFLFRDRGSDSWRQGVPTFGKMISGETDFYFPLTGDAMPAAIRIETSGYVGVGLIYLEIETASLRLVPKSIGAIEGTVIHPEALLENGRDACFLGHGEQAARQKFRNPVQSKIRHSIELNLEPEF